MDDKRLDDTIGAFRKYSGKICFVFQAYEKSFMHREAVTHVNVSTKSNFLMTASQDGHVKFWHKMDGESQTKTSSGGGRRESLVHLHIEVFYKWACQLLI